MLSKTGLSGLGHFWIYLRMSVGLPQVSSSVSRSQNWVQEGQTLLSRRLSSLPLSLSPTLSLALSFQTTSLPKIRARFFFSPPPNFHGFLSLCPVFWILNHRLFSSGVINISIMSIITHNYIHHLRHRRDHRDHHSSRINTSLSSALCAGVSCAQEFFQYNCTHNLRCFFVIRVQ